MGTLGKGIGLFKLDDSDHYVGSYFRVEDICEILEIDKIPVIQFKEALRSLKLLNVNEVVDEKDLYKHFADLKGLYSTLPLLQSVSLDECILKQIFKRALPGAIITQQIGFKDRNTNRTKHVDFKVEYNGQVKFVEFDGPTHFYNKYGNSPTSPLNRKHLIEDTFGCECVLWPFWIQRCDTNAKVLFDDSLDGLGALWSTNLLFGAFNVPNPGAIIKEENQRFRAGRENGIGYFYGGNNENRSIPEHPIIDKILKGKKSVNDILPSDITDNKEYWVPQKLWHLL